MPTIDLVRLLRKAEVAEETFAFWFEKPKNFSFTAGQYLSLTLGNVADPDPRARTHSFSIASAPYEPELMVAMRMRESYFKEQLRAMPLGSPVTVRGPYGSFIFTEDDTRPAIFLIGGIGITPVRSMVLEATQEHRARSIIVFSANRGPKNAAFLADLQLAAAENPHFTFIPTMTGTDGGDPTWTGEVGRIDRAMVERYVKTIPEQHAPRYYLVGPADMVRTMRELLSTMAISPESIMTEEFTGY